MVMTSPLPIAASMAAFMPSLLNTIKAFYCTETLLIQAIKKLYTNAINQTP
jgi:hypothetical protein